ncbi:hypothetical protein ACFHW2_24070 [Actinomadura sp. LOL_016]|uniref:hypothetical protein n=1 Tax=unclassified Actinomadura TaxID=2626254 RepID=UPI003A805895
MSPAEPVAEPADERAAELPARVEPLPYPERMRALALHARRLAGTPALGELLGELSARGRYERRTALHMAMAARDLPFVERALAGPDLGLRRAALRAVRTLPVADDAAAAVLDDAPANLRRAFYRMLRRADRPALADRLLPEVRSRWGDREAAPAARLRFPRTRGSRPSRPSGAFRRPSTISPRGPVGTTPSWPRPRWRRWRGRTVRPRPSVSCSGTRARRAPRTRSRPSPAAVRRSRRRRSVPSWPGR